MKVSVIICTYSPKMLYHLCECIDSLINQSYKNLEIICIVDGDKAYYENIREKLFKYLNYYNNIKLYLNSKTLVYLKVVIKVLS